MGPDALEVTPAKDRTATVSRPIISVRFDEPIDVASWSSLGLVVQSATGAIVPGTYFYYPSILTGTFTPSADLAPGFVYIVTIGDVRDMAGNRVRNAGSWTLKRLTATSLSMTAMPATVTYGGRAGLTGSAVLPAGEPIVLESKPAGTSAYVIADTFLPVSGRYDLAIAPIVNTWYRVSYAGSATAAPASAEVRVLVRRGVTLLGPGPATVRTAAAGAAVTLTAQVNPGGPAKVSFQLYRYDARSGAYCYAGSFGRTTGSNGRASLAWTPSAGHHYWRVAVLPSLEYANNTTPAHRWSVSR